VLGLGDEAAVYEAMQGSEQVGLADVERIAELRGRLRARDRAKLLENAALEWIADGSGRLGIVGVLDSQVGSIAGDEAKAERRWRGCTARSTRSSS